MTGLKRFLGYNNAVPIAFSVILLGGAGAFAATDPQAVYSQSQKVIAEDNTYIANKDLSTFTPKAEIIGVTEDAENYYVAYKFSTIDIKDYVWQDIVQEQTMTVAKKFLGTRIDLGLYVTGQLNQLIGHNNEYLQEVQEKARRQTSQKTVATTYGGLVGKFLDERTDVLPGYQPVVVAPPPPPPQPPVVETASVASSQPPPGDSNNAAPPPPAPPPPPPSSGMQMLGNNPARIGLNSAYVDLGVYVSDPHYQQYGIRVTLDSASVEQIQIDATKLGTHTITYTITDAEGISISATRTVEVYDQNPRIDLGTASSTDATSTPDAPIASTTPDVSPPPPPPPAETTETSPPPPPPSSDIGTSTDASSTPSSEQ